MKIILFLMTAMTPFFSVAQQARLAPDFFQPDVMTEERANGVINLTRDRFYWDKAKMFDEKTVITPSNDDERKSTPISQIDALWLVKYGSQLAELTRCNIYAQPYVNRLLTPFLISYPTEKKIIFIQTLLKTSSADVIIRRKDITCTELEKENLRRGTEFLINSSFQTLQKKRLPPVFFQPSVMTEERAYTVIRITRDELFWDKAKMFDGKTIITPSSDDERKSIPISRIEALWLVSHGSLVGELNRCDLDGQALTKKLFSPYWGVYPLEREIVFGLILLGAASADVLSRRKEIICTDAEKETLRVGSEFLLNSDVTISK